MIINRIKSPPDENKTGVIYQGKPIEIDNIPGVLKFNKKSRDYFYTVYVISKNRGELCFPKRIYL